MKYYYNYNDTYEARKRRENFQKFLTAIGIVIVTILVFCLRNFVRDMNKFHMWKDGIRSIILLILTNIVAYCIFSQTADYETFLWCLVITFTIFCVYWHIILHPKNELYNAAVWQENQYWQQFDGWEFEKEVGKLFEACGYRAEVTKGSGDGGVDIILHKDGIKSIVQCKHYSNPVSVEPVRALWGCMRDFCAQEAIFVASSGFTSGCYDFIQDKPNYKFLSLEDLSLMAAQLHGRLDSIDLSNNQKPNKASTIAIILYLLVGAIILAGLYCKEYEPKSAVSNGIQRTTSTKTNPKTKTNPIPNSSNANSVVSKNQVQPQPPTAKAIKKTTSKPNVPVPSGGTKAGTYNGIKDVGPSGAEQAEAQWNNINKSRDTETSQRQIQPTSIYDYDTTPSTSSQKQPDFGPYMRDLQRNIKANWNPPKWNTSKRVVVLFKIAKDGTLASSPYVYKSSGIPSVDDAAIRAVKITQPFKPLPVGFKGQSIDIQFTFDLNVH